MRLEGEAVGGSLAMKMLGWEQWLMEAIGELEHHEIGAFTRHAGT